MTMETIFMAISAGVFAGWMLNLLAEEDNSSWLYASGWALLFFGCLKGFAP